MQTDETSIAVGGLDQVKSAGRPPVHLWHPPFCGDIDMRIADDGTWHYLGGPITRPAMVRLFASILRKDAERYVLVTPVEMVGIAVDDVPFVATLMLAEGEGLDQRLHFTTNVGDETLAGAAHPLRFERQASDGFKPYVEVRDGLWARLTRSLYAKLVALGTIHPVDGREMFGVWSDGVFFAMAEASELSADAARD